MQLTLSYRSVLRTSSRVLPQLGRRWCTTTTPYKAWESSENLSTLLQHEGVKKFLREPLFIHPSESVATAVKKLVENQASVALVATSSQVYGTFSERDYIMKLQHGSYAPDDITVYRIMNTPFVSASPKASVYGSLKTMLQRDVRHLPLMREFKTDEPITPKDVFTVLSMEHFSRFMVPSVLEQDATYDFRSSVKADGSIHFPAHIQPMRLVLEQMRDLNQMILNINVDEDVSVAIAVNDMAQNKKMSVLVVDRQGMLQGIFTATDFISRVVAPGKDATEVLVRDVMTTDVASVVLDRSLIQCARVINERNIQHLPVILRKGGAVCGVASIVDVMRYILFGGKLMY